MEYTTFKGRTEAPVIVVEYADFECPACARFAKDTYPALKAALIDTGRIRFGFRHFPLPKHPTAQLAAVAAQCAAEQNKFWEFYETVFRRSEKLSAAIVNSAGVSLGLDKARWATCRKGEAVGIVENHLQEARTLRLKGTPVFLIGSAIAPDKLSVKTAIYGAQAVSEFENAVKQVETSKVVSVNR